MRQLFFNHIFRVIQNGDLMNNMKRLYSGNSLDDFLKIKSILDKNGIKYDTESKLNKGIGGMLSTFLSLGRPTTGLQGEHQQVYNIYVDNIDYAKAKKVIGFLE